MKPGIRRIVNSYGFLSAKLMVFTLFLFCGTASAQVSNSKTSIRASNVGVDVHDAQTVRNLASICRVWGFLKYYHNAVRSGKYDWDSELFSIIQKVGNKSNAERDSVLADWVAGLGDSAVFAYPADWGDCRYVTNISWIDSCLESKQLSKLLLKIYMQARDDFSYYVQFNPIGVPSFANEKPYSERQSPDPGFRLLALFRYWNAMKYYYPHLYSIQKKWDDYLVPGIIGFGSAKNEQEYDLSILKLITLQDDAHSRVEWFDEEPLNQYFGRRIAPLRVEYVDGVPTVTEFDSCYKCGLDTNSGIYRGDQILKINGIPADSLYVRLSPVVPGSNVGSKLRNMAPYLLRTNDTIIDLEIARRSEILKIRLKTALLYFVGPKKRNDPGFKVLDGNIGYLNPSLVKSVNLVEAMDKVAGLKGLIIDFRKYPAMELIEVANRLFDSARGFAVFTRSSASYPGNFCYSPFYKMRGEPDGKRMNSKVVLLMNEYSQSAAEFRIMAFRRYENARLVGSQTAGADGDVTKIVLPGGANVVFTSLGVYYPDGRETQRVGIKPDILVQRTVEGVRQGRDEVLEAGIREILK